MKMNDKEGSLEQSNASQSKPRLAWCRGSERVDHMPLRKARRASRAAVIVRLMSRRVHHVTAAFAYHI